MVRKIVEAMHRKRADLLVLFWLGLIYFFTYFQRVAVPGTVFNEIQHDLGISSSAVTLIGAMYLYSYGGMQILSGMTIDRFGALRTAIVGGLMMSTGSILFALSHSLTFMCGTRLIVGIGSSLMYLCIVKQLAVRFHDKSFSMLISASQAFGFCGGLFATFPFERSVDAIGWRSSLLVVGLVSMIVVITAALSSRSEIITSQNQQAPASPIGALKTVVQNRMGYPVIIGNAIIYANYFVVQAVIGKKLLEDCCGASSPTAASFTFITMLTAMIAGVVGGFIPQIMGHRRKPMLITASLGAVVASGLMIMNLKLGVSAVWMLPAYILFGLISAGISIFCSSMKELNPPDSAATAIGVSNSVCWLTIAVVSTACGLVMDRFRAHAVVTQTAIKYPPEAYQMIFTGLMLFSLCAVGLSVMVKETKGRNRWIE